MLCADACPFSRMLCMLYTLGRQTDAVHQLKGVMVGREPEKLQGAADAVSEE